MNDSTVSPGHATHYFYDPRMAWFAVAAWTILIGLSLLWNASNEHKRVIELAKAETRANLNKDKAFRLWATAKGGFYIPVGKSAQPSPFLAHLPNRDVITTSGTLMTLFNPAIVVKEVAEQFQALSGVKAKWTHTVYLNPANAPDPWEVKALERFMQGSSEVSEITVTNGRDFLRMAHPMKMEAGCMKCHVGIVGGLGGSTVISVPFDPYRQLARGAVVNLAQTHGGIWFVGLGVIGFIARRTRQYEAERTVTVSELRKLSRAVEASASAIMIMNEHDEIQYVNEKFCQLTGYRPEEVAHRPSSIFKSSDTDRSLHRKILETLRSGNEWKGEIRNRKKDGTEIYCLESRSIITDESERITHFVAVLEDISERKVAEETITRLAYYDSLTDLPNRRHFHERLEQAAALCRRSGGRMAVFYLDLDRFKSINDTLGHGAGDALLKLMAQRLSSHLLRETDVVARLGGDEFAIISLDVSHSAAAVVAEKLIGVARQPLLVEDNELHLTVSVGISMFPDDTSNLDELIKFADIALYDAKAQGKNTFRFYSKDTNVLTIEHLKLENDLRKAVERQELFLVFQPQINVCDNTLFGVEALVRWRHPELGIIYPERFIPLAEETHLIGPIGAWVLEQACRQVTSWDAAGLPPFGMAVNLSALQFHGKTLLKQVKKTLAEFKLAPQRLTLEITESTLMSDPKKTGEILHALRNLGVRIAIDDFGTGYSSLNYLRRFPVNTLKIDQSFVREITTGRGAKALSGTIVALGNALGLRVIAEGVETEEQLQVLRGLDCECAQGYLYSRPVAPEALPALLRRFPFSSPTQISCSEIEVAYGQKMDSVLARTTSS